MPLESCMICMDNSEWMRNGDFAPDRMAQLTDTVKALVNRLLNPPSHPESTLGLLTMAGKTVEVRASPTRDDAKLRSSMHGIAPTGKVNFAHALKIGFLALKHRLNKAGQQRLVAFVGSPILEKDATLKRIAKELRKNNVGVDIVSMGEHEANAELLDTFINTVNKEDNSHLIVVSPGSNLSSAVLQSPVAGDAAAAGGGGAGGGGQYGGADPNEDPDLAMALMQSLQEEEQRRGQSQGGEGQEGSAAPAGAPAGGGGGEDEDALLQQALALSMQEASQAQGGGGAEAASASASAPAPAPATTEASAPATTAAAAEGSGGDGAQDEDAAALAAALALSQQQDESAASSSGGNAPVDEQAMFNNPDFVQSLLGDLPGVDMNDPQLQAMMGSLAGQGQQGQQGEEKKEGEGKDGEGKDGEGKDGEGGSGSGQQ